jgi:xylosylprotein 4-beta-galactosyltransferase
VHEVIEKVNSLVHVAIIFILSLRFWGWGQEDDDLSKRIKHHKITKTRPDKKTIGTGQKDTFLNTHNAARTRDTGKCKNQTVESESNCDDSGLKYFNYNLTGVQELTIDGAQLTLINVDVPCNRTATPWCEC